MEPSTVSRWKLLIILPLRLMFDITNDDLENIGTTLGYQPLSETTREPSLPVLGTLFGRNSRVFIPMVLSWRSKSINVNFLLDTASPNTYLREETFVALGFGNTPKSTTVIVHGINHIVHPSTPNFKNVDILGQDYLQTIAVQVEITYPLRQAILRRYVPPRRRSPK